MLKAARESTDGKIIAVVQPHRFTRLQSLFEEFCTCFNDADAVVVAEVYPAGEAPIAGIDRDHFVLGLRAHGHREVIPLPNSGGSRRRRSRDREAAATSSSASAPATSRNGPTRCRAN